MPTLPRVEAKDDPHHVPALGAQRHTDSKLVGPLRHRVGHHAVKADGGKSEGQPGQEALEIHAGQMLLLPLRFIGDPGIEILDVGEDLLLRVHGRHLRSYGMHQRQR